jgi:hypothetical protein
MSDALLLSLRADAIDMHDMAMMVMATVTEEIIVGRIVLSLRFGVTGIHAIIQLKLREIKNHSSRRYRLLTLICIIRFFFDNILIYQKLTKTNMRNPNSAITVTINCSNVGINV